MNEEKFMYHVGLLAKDRDPEFSKLSYDEAMHLDTIARNIMKANEAGNVELSQVKIDEGVYEYYYTKKGK